MSQRSEHCAIELHWFEQCVQEGAVEIIWVDTSKQLADIFTKGLKKAEFLEKQDDNLCMKLATNSFPNMSQRSEHCAMESHWFEQCAQEGAVEVIWVDASKQLTDIFTEGLKKAEFLEKQNCQWEGSFVMISSPFIDVTIMLVHVHCMISHSHRNDEWNIWIWKEELQMSQQLQNKMIMCVHCTLAQKWQTKHLNLKGRVTNITAITKQNDRKDQNEMQMSEFYFSSQKCENI